MMRETKFKTWVENDFITNSVYPYMMDAPEFSGSINEIFAKSGIQPLNKLHSKITYMQYTGLKDKHGMEIYERDIVQIKGHPFEGHINIDGNYEVYYNEVMELCCGNLILHRQLPYVTVIGNKFENPELLNN